MYVLKSFLIVFILSPLFAQEILLASEDSPPVELGDLDSKKNGHVTFLSEIEQDEKAFFEKLLKDFNNEKYKDVKENYDDAWTFEGTKRGSLMSASYLQMGQHYYQMNWYLEALLNYEMAFGKEGVNPSWKNYYEAGLSACKCKKKEKALTYFQKALDRTKTEQIPWYVHATTAIVALELQNSDTKKILGWMQTALSSIPDEQPQRGRLYIDAGVAAFLHKNSQLALNYLQQGFDLVSNFTVYLQAKCPQVLFFLCGQNAFLRGGIHRELLNFFDFNPDREPVKALVTWTSENHQQLQITGSSLQGYTNLAKDKPFYKRSNPYWLHAHVREKRKEEVNWKNVNPEKEDIAGQTIKMNPAFFQKQILPPYLTFKDLPNFFNTAPKIHYPSAFFENMGKGLKKNHGNLLKVLDNGRLQRLLNYRGENQEKVPLVQTHLIHLAKSIQGRSDKLSDGETLTGQQYWFLTLLKEFAFVNSQADFYVTITRLYTQWLVPEDVKKTKTERERANLVIRTTLEEMFYGNNPFTQELLPQDILLKEETRYLRNVIGPDVGLGNEVEFYLLPDQLHKKIIYVSKERILRAFYKNFKPSFLISKLTDMGGFKENDALNLLKEIGVLTVVKGESLEEGWTDWRDWTDMESLLKEAPRGGD